MEIETSARLHLSLIDLNGLEGRLDGGIGITLEKPSLKMECAQTNDDTIVEFNENISLPNFGLYESKIMEATTKMKEYFEIEDSYSFKINEMYQIHHGLGLGTQLALSTAKLISSLNDMNLTGFELANIIQRGGTSGIGVHSFDKGGLIIDGGHKKSIKNDFLPSSASKVSPPPLLARYDFPKDWDIILVTPNVSQGASGNEEIDIFQSYSPININEVEKICYLTLMKLMPSVIENDIESFGDSVNKIQSMGFKRIERDLQGAEINNVLEGMESLGIPCVGMSSFGPTCFGITDSLSKKLKKELIDIAGNDTDIIFTKGKNHGAIIK
ncbi:MAG: hypothetical protein E7Z85_07235 [Methanosphaera stadtmanae]|nr:hypothetical protein [Methanosphaera stadtmanae]